MEKHSGVNCFICGKPLKYLNPAEERKCEICGNVSSANAVCESGHFVCDKCHTKDSRVFISEYALSTKSKNPLLIAEEMMKNESVNMHGPEHHYLAVAALLAAYANAGGKIDLHKSLEAARQRAEKVPGGICGFWGSCGAGVASGMFVSIITGATPLSKEEWGLANLATSEALAKISKGGGPRCCKRDVYTSLLSAIDFTAKHFKVQMEKTENMKCVFSGKNGTCKKTECSYFNGTV